MPDWGSTLSFADDTQPTEPHRSGPTEKDLTEEWQAGRSKQRSKEAVRKEETRKKGRLRDSLPIEFRPWSGSHARLQRKKSQLLPNPAHPSIFIHQDGKNLLVQAKVRTGLASSLCFQNPCQVAGVINI